MNKIKDTEISILGLLIDSPAHGYQINKMIAGFSGIGVIWRINIANLYAVLKRLENEDYIQSEIFQEKNRPARKMYTLTEQGRELFMHWISSPVKQGRDFRILFLLKFYFALLQSSKNARELISAQKKITNHWLEKIQVDGDKELDESEFRPFIKKFRQTQIHAYQEWLSWCEEALKEKMRKNE